MASEFLCKTYHTRPIGDYIAAQKDRGFWDSRSSNSLLRRDSVSSRNAPPHILRDDTKNNSDNCAGDYSTLRKAKDGSEPTRMLHEIIN